MNRRAFCILLTIVALLTAVVPLRDGRAEETTVTLSVGEIDGSGIALREKANSDSKLLTRLEDGDMVKILQANVNGEWYKVTAGNRTGYVNRLYVNIEPSVSSYQLKYNGAVVNCNEFVNVRSAPNSKGKVLGKANKGAILAVTEAYASASYHKVDYNGEEGYISAQYMELKAQVDNSHLTGLKVEGGVLYPRFSPNEYGYICVASAGEVNVTGSANDGVKVSIGATGVKSAKYTINSGNSKTIRISVGGKVKYSVYLVRDVLTVGTWNIKRGNEHLLEQGWLIANERPDIIGVQEVYVNDKDNTDNLLSLRTRQAQHTVFAKTIDYASGGEYGIGQISRYEKASEEVFELETGSAKEPRILQKVVYNIDGKTVSVYNTHFSYESSTIRRKQFDKVYKTMLADENPYKILTGDFNAKENEFYEFKKGPYKVVNTSATKFYDYAYKRIGVNQIDNIIVSNNITVLNARAIPTAYSDHYPLFAFLKLK